jgi:hypothetical protein
MSALFRPRGLALVVVSLLLAGLALPQHAVVCAHEATTVAPASQNGDPQSLPLSAQASISAVLGRDDASYHVVPLANGLRANNPKQALVVDFTPRGVEVRSGGTRWGLVASSCGYGPALMPVADAPPQGSANRVEYRRGALTEWYVNGPLGLEQGFTLDTPPGPRASGHPLTLSVALSGDLEPSVDPDSSGLTLREADGTAVLHYGGLSAFDAAGRELPVRVAQEGSQVRLLVDDTAARYPVVIDPFVQAGEGTRARLITSVGAMHDRFGFSVAISGDTVVVGTDDRANTEPRSAYVFVEPAGGWSGRLTQTARLEASDGAPGDQFGHSVAISGDRVVVGARSDTIGGNVAQGSAYVFVEPAGGWSGRLTQTAKLVASDGEGFDAFGWDVAIDGDTVVVGAISDEVGGNSAQGSAYVFVEPAGGWGGNLTETAKLVASDGAASDDFGGSVAISGDTVVVGAHTKDIGGINQQGAAYVFVEPAGGWEGNLTETAGLLASDGAVFDNFGVGVAIGGDTVVVGSFGDDIGGNVSQGSAFVFVEPVGGWGGNLTETAKLVASDGAANDTLGRSVAISGDRVVVGAHDDDVGSNPDQGSVYLFDEPAGGWGGSLTETAKLVASDGAALDSFGISVAVSADTFLVGAYRDDVGNKINQGSGYVFVLP